MSEYEENDDPQVKACKTFVQSLKDDLKNVNDFDITGWNAKRVIGLLKSIVNDREKYTEDSTFNFKITQTSGPGNSFKLVANPSVDQPGNEVITNISANERANKSPRHGKLCETLKKRYKDDTRSFAKDIKDVFANNLKIFEVPEVTRSAYMILLFEIGRRLVIDDEKSSDEKKKLDKLPIASAIARLVKLMEANRCTFEEVFLKDHAGRKLYCFSGDSHVRKEAISNIDYLHALNEIGEMFCQETDLQARFQGLTT